MSLKTKILLGISFLLLMAISFNLVYSYKLISEDKKSYIFESSLNHVEKLTNDFVGNLQALLSRVNSYYLLSQTSSEELEKIINSEEMLLAFIAWDLNGEHQFISSRIEEISSFEIGEFKEWVSELETSEIDEQIGPIQVSFETLRNVPVMILDIDGENLLLRFYLNLESFRGIFLDEGSFSSFLVTENQVIIGPPAIENELLEIIDQRVEAKGSFEFIGEDDDFLVSFSKFEDFNFTILSYLSKSDAFRFLSYLIYNNIFVGTSILGFSLMIGFLFSRQITAPVFNLVAATKRIAEGDYGTQVQVKSKDEMNLLANSFNSMSTQIHELLGQKEEMINELSLAKEKLEDYSQNLEKMVEERTRELKEANDFIEAMINSLDQGLFVIDKELKCLDIYTKACDHLFETQVGGRKFTEILGSDSTDEASIQKWGEILFSEKIPFDSAKGLGPKNKINGDLTLPESYKHIDLEYCPMRSENEEINNVVVVATDKTKEVLALKQFEEKSAYVDMILKLVRFKGPFFKFFDGCSEMFTELENLFSQNEIPLDKVMFLYHSMNGGFGTYSLLDLQTTARNCEQRIVDFRKHNVSLEEMRPDLLSDFEAFKKLFLEKRAELEGIFGDKRDVKEIELHTIFKFREFLQGKSVDDELLGRYLEDFERTEIREFFTGYSDLVASLSRKLNKPMKPLRIENGDVKVHVKFYDEFFNSLVHLFRNCMDHGIEKSALRKEREKEPEGLICVTTEVIQRNGDELLEVSISDDGGGINPDVIRKKWLEMYPTENLDHLSDSEVIYKIFDPNFSTAEQVTDVSGRGVGMSSIKDVVDELRGEIKLESHVSRGTKFTFILPYV